MFRRMPEVAGDAALLVDPADVQSIAEGLRKLTEDAALRAELAQKGLETKPGIHLGKSGGSEPGTSTRNCWVSDRND